VVEVDGKKHMVKVVGGGAVFDVSRCGKLLLRVKITAEVDGVRREYAITFDRDRANNEAKGYANASADAPGGRYADAERYLAPIKALTGREPWIQRMKDGRIKIATRDIWMALPATPSPQTT
jgi:hypothetical protein